MARTRNRSRDLPRLFAYFGVDARPDQVQEHGQKIAARFRAELHEIERRCSGLRERERFVVIRAALSLAYGAAVPAGS